MELHKEKAEATRVMLIRGYMLIKIHGQFAWIG